MDESTSPAPQLPPEASDDGFAFSLRALREAWADVLANDLEDGVPAPGVVRFADDEPAQLSRLHRQLAEGTYVPQPLTELAIPKDGDSGAVRMLQIPAVRDRVVSRAALAAIAPRVDRHLGSAAFAYRPGLGVVDAVDMVVSLRESGCGWVLRTDVDDCFPTIPVELARRRLGALVDDSIVLGVADVLLARRVIAAGHRGSRPLRGLAQGCALSPVLETLQRWFRVSRLNGHAVRLAMQRIETVGPTGMCRGWCGHAVRLAMQRIETEPERVPLESVVADGHAVRLAMQRIETATRSSSKRRLRASSHAVRLAMQRIETPGRAGQVRAVQVRSRCTSRDAANRNFGFSLIDDDQWFCHAVRLAMQRIETHIWPRYVIHHPPGRHAVRLAMQRIETWPPTCSWT